MCPRTPPACNGNSRDQEGIRRLVPGHTHLQRRQLTRSRSFPSVAYTRIFLLPSTGRMSSLLSLPQWRGPVRQKSSTPFFPGAWPGTPSAAHSLEGGTSGPDDIEALKQIDERQTVDPSLPHLDHVTDFHRRISQSFIGPATRRSSGPKGINVEIPQSPHLTGLSEYTVSFYDSKMLSQTE